MKPEDQPKEKWTMMGKQSPQNPQSFYTMDAPHNITAGTILVQRTKSALAEFLVMEFSSPF